MRKLAILIAVLALAASMACAEVLETTGSVNVRDMPSLAGNVLGAVPEGTRVEYLGESAVDDRGVDWYKVWFEEREGWMSSKYATPVEGGKQSRDDIFETLGILTSDDTINVTGWDAERSGEQLKLRVTVDGGVYCGGTDGYAEPWLVGEGIAAETDADLDGDGEDELLVIHCAQTEDDETAWTGIIYERDGDGYVRTAEFPLDILTHGTSSRGVKLLRRDRKLCVAVIRVDEWDGGGRGVSATLFDYDGQVVTLPFIATAEIVGESYAVIGAFPLDWYEEFDGWAISSRARLEAMLEGYGEVYSFSPYEESIFQDPDFAEHARDEDIIGPEEHERTVEIMKQYGVEVIPHVVSEEEDGESWKTITLLEKDEGETLLWVQETDNYSDEDWIDIELHTRLDHGVE